MYTHDDGNRLDNYTVQDFLYSKTKFVPKITANKSNGSRNKIMKVEEATEVFSVKQLSIDPDCNPFSFQTSLNIILLLDHSNRYNQSSKTG